MQAKTITVNMDACHLVEDIIVRVRDLMGVVRVCEIEEALTLLKGELSEGLTNAMVESYEQRELVMVIALHLVWDVFDDGTPL